MIVDLQAFANRGQPSWDELDALLERLAEQPERLDLADAARLHELYERACADLLALGESYAGSDLHSNLETLVGRAYGEIHAGRRVKLRWTPGNWFLRSFPRTFRRHIRLFALASLITLGGGLLGGVGVLVDPVAKQAVLPFHGVPDDPVQRVRHEERHSLKEQERRSEFSAALMANNIRVSVNALALGVTCGVGTGIVLFYNGVILGAVCADYVAAGQSRFLVAWLLPHGAIEIPCILIAGQSGLLLGLALLGRRRREPLAVRLRAVRADLVTLVGGGALLLVWAAIVESFLSQYHAPSLYGAKIAFGALQAFLLAMLLWRGGAASGEAAS